MNTNVIKTEEFDIISVINESMPLDKDIWWWDGGSTDNNNKEE